MSTEIPIVFDDVSRDAKIIMIYPINSNAGWPKAYALQHPKTFDIPIPKGTRQIQIATTPTVGGHEFLNVDINDDKLRISLASWCFKFKMEIGFILSEN